MTLISERNERINLVDQIVTVMRNNKYRNTLLRPTINASNCTWHTNRSLLKMRETRTNYELRPKSNVTLGKWKAER